MSSQTSSLEARVEIDHGQFYLVSPDGDTTEVWDGGALERHLGAVRGLVAIGASCGYGSSSVRVEILDAVPDGIEQGFDHMVEVSAEFEGPELVVSECLGNERVAALPLTRGTYRVRVSFAGLENTSTESEDCGSMVCQLWPAPWTEPSVLKQYPGWAPQADLVNPFGLAVMVGARAWDERLRMQPIGMRRGTEPGQPDAFLFRDADGRYWEYGSWHGTDLIEVPESEVPNYPKSW